MSRNQNGTYYLPAGNPVAPLELITAEWANGTLDDVAQALTESLDRQGLGGMTGQLKVADGNASNPGVAFTNEVSTGLFRESAGVMGLSVRATKLMEFRQSVIGMNVDLGMALGKVLSLGGNPLSPLSAAPKQYVDALGKRVDAMSSQVTRVVGQFGQSKTPADLPVNGIIPANFDAVGVPIVAVQMLAGQSLVYQPVDPLAQYADDLYIFVGKTFDAAGWLNVGHIQGPPGEQGEPGEQGHMGDDGAPGPTGPQGQQGITGDTGATGSKGAKGDDGPTGPQGIQGPIGETGETGAEGPKGDDGPVGPQGDQGPTGATGDTGPEGPKGDDGPTGPQGFEGSPGASTVIIGNFGFSKTPADLPPNGFIPKDWDAPDSPPFDYQMIAGQALVYTDCAIDNPEFGYLFDYVGQITGFELTGWANCGDIRGAQGPMGATGSTGETGPIGPTGDQGPIGEQGQIGETGTTGETGPTGLTGDQGPEGPQGVIGETGTTGETGAEGAAGKDGADGGTGPAGANNVLNIGTVDSGTTPNATITGSSPTQTLNLTLVPGPQGAAGKDGTSGGFVPPAGYISLWWGEAATIPGGWAICDGTLGTPDLRDVFVVGAGGKLLRGAVGGAATMSLDTNTMPSHAHGWSGGDSGHGHGNSAGDYGHNHVYDQVIGGSGVAGGPGLQLGAGGTSNASANVYVNISGGNANVYGTVAASGSGAAFSIVPPYFALFYIMKLQEL